MGLFERLFGSSATPESQPDIRFGRYSDSYKEDANFAAWNDALHLFEEDKYLESYQAFFKYLRDEHEDNVRYWMEEDTLYFEFYQGSKKISGQANEDKLKAESRIARTHTLNVGFMRRLIEKNFSLKYSRFALDGKKNLTIVFDTYSLDGSPYKLYYALKEVATNADKQDDLLLDEFRMLEPVDTSHLSQLPEAEKEVKFKFTHDAIDRVLKEIDENKLDKDQYPGGVAYLLLNLVYTLDYLIKPEGYMMETLEHAHRVYFKKDGRTTALKNIALQKELQKLLKRPREEYFKEMYRVKSTFGITNPVNHDRVVSFIDGELHHMDWYLDNGHPSVAQAIPGYIVGYCLFNYAIPKPDHDLFHLYYQIIDAEYFRDLGFSIDFRDGARLNKRAIRKAIEAIVERNARGFPRLNPVYATLQYDSLPVFSRSFLHMVRQLDMTKAD